MTDSDDFTAVARVLENSTPLSDLQSRGLVRRLLNQAGLNAAEVSAPQLMVVARSLLRDALLKNGVPDPDGVLAQWLECCAKQEERSRGSQRMRVSNTVEEVFARIGLRRT